MPQLPYPFVCWWASRLLPCPGYYKQCCDEHWGARDRVEREVGGGIGWGIHVTPWLIHVNVWQKPLQHCRVISLQLIKINDKKKKKNLPVNAGDAEDMSWICGLKIPWRRKWQLTPIFLPGKFHGQTNLAGYSMGLQRVGHHWATERTHTPIISDSLLLSPNFSETGLWNLISGLLISIYVVKGLLYFQRSCFKVSRGTVLYLFLS